MKRGGKMSKDEKERERERVSQRGCSGGTHVVSAHTSDDADEGIKS